MVARFSLLIAVCAALATAAAAAPATPSVPYHLTAIRPFLFFNDSGRFSPEIPETAALWNTIIGEGWAGESSNATLVRVDLAGPAGSYNPKARVRLTVQRGRTTPSGPAFSGVKTVQVSGVPVVASRGRTTLGFWIADTGCRPLRLTAELVGQTPVERLTRDLNFACGE